MQYLASEATPTLAKLFSLRERTALVIGGAGLLGREISHAFAELGASVLIASRDVSKCIDFVKELKADYPDGQFMAFELDISTLERLEQGFSKIANVLPTGLDILVNSGWSGRKNTFESISDEDWNLDIEVCLNGVFRTVKAAVPLLKMRKGNILNVASMYGHVAPDYRLYDNDKLANPPSYGAAKAGIIQLTKYLASFLSPYGIRTNCISPGPFPFIKTQEDNPAFIERLKAKNPLNRIGLPYEIKGAVALLCSDAGSYMTGQNVCIDGGWSVW